MLKILFKIKILTIFSVLILYLIAMSTIEKHDLNKLTVIIPFLNEDDEVYNTVKSIRDTSDNLLPIILINDASTDDYDYKSVAKEFNTQYVLHTERKGVAASCDESVDLSETKYFLLC